MDYMDDKKKNSPGKESAVQEPKAYAQHAQGPAS